MPSSFVCALFCRPVAKLVAVTVTLGTEAALGSVTRPSMLPVVACDCALMPIAIDKSIATIRGALNSIILSFVCRQDLQDYFSRLTGWFLLILKTLVNPDQKSVV